MWSPSPSLDIVSPAMAGLAVALYLVLLAAGTAAAIVLMARLRKTTVPWHSLAATLRGRDWTWHDAGAVLSAQFLLLLVAVLVSRLLHQPTVGELMVLETMFFNVLGLAFLLVFLRFSGRSWTTAFGHPSITPARGMRAGVVFYLAMLPMIFFSSLVYQGILSVHGYPPALQEVALLLTRDHPLWMRTYLILLAILLAPVLEECLFRGIALPLLSRRLGTGTAVLATSLLFAAIHFHLPSFAPLCLMAVGFSVAYLYSGSLWVPITMHSLFNGVNVVLLWLLSP